MAWANKYGCGKSGWSNDGFDKLKGPTVQRTLSDAGWVCYSKSQATKQCSGPDKKAGTCSYTQGSCITAGNFGSDQQGC